MTHLDDLPLDPPSANGKPQWEATGSHAWCAIHKCHPMLCWSAHNQGARLVSRTSTEHTRERNLTDIAVLHHERRAAYDSVATLALLGLTARRTEAG